MLNRISQNCPGDGYEPGQLTKYFIEQAIIVRKLPDIAEHFKEVVEILINGLREDLKFTSSKKDHVKSLASNLKRYTEDLEIATLEVFRASHYADVEEIDDDVDNTLEILNEMAFDARSNLTVIHLLIKRKLPPYLKTTTAPNLESYLLAKHQKTLDVTNLSTDFITKHSNEIKLWDKSELN